MSETTIRLKILGKFFDELWYSTKCLLDEMSIRRNGLFTKWVSTECCAPTRLIAQVVW